MLTDAAATSRTSVRELRTLLVDIYPPNLEGSGLAPAIADLLAGLGPGITVESDLAELPDLDPRLRGLQRRCHGTGEDQCGEGLPHLGQGARGHAGR